MTGHLVGACWCGGKLGKEIGPHYRSCNECGAAVLAVLPSPEHFEVSEDERDFYGRRYWTDYSRARGLPDIGERVRSDLSERCLFWLERLLESTRPPGRALEIGCGHGGFVRLMRELGFDAMGTELSGWVVEFAKRTFDVPVQRGRLETLDLEPGFKCIVAFDVLEHLRDPLETVRRCGELLTPNGLLLLQTPWYRGEGADWSMFQADEHIHLFTEGSIRLLMDRAGFQEVLVRPSLFPYDMWVVATRGCLPNDPASEIDAGDWRLPAAFQGLLGLSRQAQQMRKELAVAEVDRVTRLEDVTELTALLRDSEADRAARLDQIGEQGRQLQELEAVRLEDVKKLTALLREAEADRAARLEQIGDQGRQLQELEAARVAEVKELTALLREAEADRAARLEQIGEQGRQLQELEAARLEDVTKLTVLLREAEMDRAARLEQIGEQGRQLQELEAARLEDVRKLTALLREAETDREARFDRIQDLSQLLREAEADREARLDRIQELSQLLRETEADRAARLDRIHELSQLLREAEADRAARLDRIHELSQFLREAEADRAARLQQIHELSQLLREAEADRAAQLEVIQSLKVRTAEIERTWAWRLYSRLPVPLTGRKPEKRDRNRGGPGPTG